MKYILTGLVLLSILFAQSGNIKYVDPFIGTDGHAHTFPGATTPFGMVQLSPDTDNKGWDWCSGYHYSDNSIMGFSHTHLSGTGATDYGDILFMPFNGKVFLNPGEKNNPDEGYRSKFSHNTEKASAGYYAVKLIDNNIDVELTVTPRTGFHKYVFNNTLDKKIIIDLEHGISDKAIETYFEIVDNKTIKGYRKSKGWASDHTVFFYAQFNENFNTAMIYNQGEISEQKIQKGENLKSVVSFDNNISNEILVKVGISHVSLDGAKFNLNSENSDWDFEEIKSKAEKLWKNELDKIEVTTKNKDLKTIFYTALYHSLIAPNIYSDADGNHMGMDKKVYNTNTNQYTVFSLWDTYRALHPLLAITDTKRTEEFVNTIINKYNEYGLLPIWELAGNETNCMIGYHSIPVLLDSYVKGINNIDLDKVLEAVQKSGMQNIRGTDIYRKCGIIPSELDNEGVSKTLEYAYDDWCIAQLAKLNSNEKVYNHYIERSKNYLNYFDPETKFMRPKRNGKWVDNFDPTSVTSDFTEANSWQYTFSVQHDIPGLINLYGSNEIFSKKLDELFIAKSELKGRHQPDITGLIGQYAHGNEPSHHVAYLYNYVNEAWKTQEKTRLICDSLYNVGPNGLCGNEDCGQLSAWYVFSSIGFYPVTPGSDKYLIGSPIFDNVEIKLENGNVFSVKAINNSKENIYIQSLTIDGKKYNKPFVKHSDIINGASLVFTMGSEPNKKWGSDIEDLFNQKEIKKLPQPVLVSGEILFIDSTTIKIDPLNSSAKVFYTTDGTTPNVNSNLYGKPFSISENTKLKFRSFATGYLASSINEVDIMKKENNWTIKLLTEYHTSYPGGGKNTLIDGLRGGNNYRTGQWQGYDGKDFEAVIDLGKETEINKLGCGFYQDYGVWIFLPKIVKFFVSNDGKNFREIVTIKNRIATDANGIITEDLVSEINKTKARYVKIIVESIKVCPDWHSGAGLDCFIFMDEIIIE